MLKTFVSNLLPHVGAAWEAQAVRVGNATTVGGTLAVFLVSNAKLISILVVLLGLAVTTVAAIIRERRERFYARRRDQREQEQHDLLMRTEYAGRAVHEK